MLPLLLDPAIFWQLLGSYEAEPVEFDPWQLFWLRNHHRYRAVEKAPQIGWSWLCAAEALHECLMFYDATSTFISVDMREAAEKVLYARKLYNELPPLIQEAIPMPRDNTDELWFGETARPSRLLSLPNSSAMRGRRMSVYLDEADFYRDGGRDAFRAGMGRVARGGRVSIGSTCWGEGTQLDNTCRRNTDEVEEAKNFSVFRLPFTVVQKPDVREAIDIAISELDPADALEEYGCVRGGAVSDSFPPSLLRRQTAGEDIESFQGNTQQLRLTWETGREAMGGFDVGKSRDPSVITILERFPDARWYQTVLHIPRNGEVPLSLPDQHDLLVDLLQRSPNLKMVVDANGLGAHMFQSLRSMFGAQRVIEMIAGAKPDGLPPQTKDEMGTEIKRGLESDELMLMQNRDQAEQFSMTKLQNGKVEQPKMGRRTHYDLFWATTYAWYGTTAASAVRSIYQNRGLYVVGG